LKQKRFCVLRGFLERNSRAIKRLDRGGLAVTTSALRFHLISHLRGRGEHGKTVEDPIGKTKTGDKNFDRNRDETTNRMRAIERRRDSIRAAMRAEARMKASRVLVLCLAVAAPEAAVA
jgi:50S ribosomal subunit-associated GTPase HflX